MENSLQLLLHRLSKFLQPHFDLGVNLNLLSSSEFNFLTVVGNQLLNRVNFLETFASGDGKQFVDTFVDLLYVFVYWLRVFRLTNDFQKIFI